MARFAEPNSEVELSSFIASSGTMGKIYDGAPGRGSRTVPMPVWLASRSHCPVPLSLSRGALLRHARETRADAAHSRCGPLDVVPRQAAMVVAHSIQLNWNVR